ncbi:hypothetical protein I4U23_016375 [Adineta vaga]|nr:hypothetical protein I4U23_016375 [Adineta vaga]
MNEFERCPAELFHVLFEYFWAHEILHLFSNLNNRIDLILKFYSTYRINFQSIRKSDFDLICEQIPPEQIISLILSDQNDTIGQSKLFLSYFQIEKLINLRYLSLIRIKHEPLHRILSNLYKLNRLHSLSFDSSGGKGVLINKDNIFNEFDDKIYSILPKHYPEILPKLKYLSTYYSDELTLIHFPYLHQLRLYSSSFDHINEIFQHSPQLQCVTLFLNSFQNFHQIQSCHLLKRLYLIISEIKNEYELSDMSIIDGYRWQTITQSLMSFNFLLLVQDNLTEQSLDSFRTSFWIEEKHWFIAFYDKHLFTVSVSDFALPYMKLTSETSLYSTIPNNTLLYRSKYSIFQRRIVLNKNTFRFTSIKHLGLHWNDSFEILSSIIDINQLQTLTFLSNSYYLLKYMQYHMPNLRILNFQGVTRPLELLLEKGHLESVQLKQIRTLRFKTYLFQNEPMYYPNKLCHAFPFIEHLDTWPIRSRSDIIYCIEKFPRLTSATFYIHHSVNNASRCSELVPNLILNDIKQFFNCSATCHVDFYGQKITVPQHIHIWLGERFPNGISSNYQQPRFKYLWNEIKDIFHSFY